MRRAFTLAAGAFVAGIAVGIAIAASTRTKRKEKRPKRAKPPQRRTPAPSAPSQSDALIDNLIAKARAERIKISADDHVLLLTRSAFLEAGTLRSFDACRNDLITLGEARAAANGQGPPCILAVLPCLSGRGETFKNEFAEAGELQHVLEQASELLVQQPRFQYVWLVHSCVATSRKSAASSLPSSGSGLEELDDETLRHWPLALLRADSLLLIPPLVPYSGNKAVRVSDLRTALSEARCRTDLAVAGLGGAELFFSLSVKAENCGARSVFARLPPRQAISSIRSAINEALAAQRPEAPDSQSTSVYLLNVTAEDWSSAAEEADADPEALLVAARDDFAAVSKGNGSKTARAVALSVRPEPKEVRRYFSATWRLLGAAADDSERVVRASVLLFAVALSRSLPWRSYAEKLATPTEVTYKSIATVRSPFSERFGTPRQPGVKAGVAGGGEAVGQVVFARGQGYEAALEDLEGFDMIWIISHMHLNKGWNPKVRPPRLRADVPKKGLFSTRAPHRPNALALSAVRVRRVCAAEAFIEVEGLDLLDGTPVLDVKPYVPYVDAFPSAKAGWVDEFGATDHNSQADRLKSFSVGAALSHRRAAAVPPLPATNGGSGGSGGGASGSGDSGGGSGGGGSGGGSGEMSNGGDRSDECG